MIEEYKTGIITVNGKNYNNDIFVDWKGEISDWEHKEEHLIDVDDVRFTVEKNPETIVLGTGENGLLEISESAQNFIMEKGIKLVADRTEEAVKTFNILKENSLEEEGQQEKVIGLFHLT